MQTIAADNGNCSDDVYDAFLERFAKRFSENVSAGKPLFTTDAEDLFAVYLGAFAEHDRQYYNCSACRAFINRFGGIVTIDTDGTTQTPMWFEEDAPEFYRAPIQALAKAVRRAKVNGVFLCSESVLGTPKTGTWTHLSVSQPSLYKSRLLTAGQAMAEKREDYGIVNRALAEFKLEQIEQALTLLGTDALYRAEKVVGPVRWLRDLHVARDGVHGSRKGNVVWLAVATAPPGFCHPRSSMAGTLLEDIAAGMSFDDVSRRFAAKMHPLLYQRPLAAPSAGNIAQGEKVIEAMGAQRSLLRRFARLEEIDAIWKPKEATPQKPSGSGVFGHLKAKGDTAPFGMDVPAQTMTWDKFQRTVLPTASMIEVYSPARGNYGATLTAVDMEAPPILQWDTPEKRNPFSWYVWHGGATAEQFSLAPRAWHKLSAISFKPSMWREANLSHQSKGVMFIIADARETRQSGAALFPEILKAEFHAVRATIEAYSRSAELEGMADGTACGLLADSSNKAWSDIVLRVTTNGRPVQYKLDRWD